MSLTKVSHSMISGMYANVLDFGADPTGVADSTAAIQAAINFLEGSGTLDFGLEGIYKVSSTISYTSPQGLHLTSSGYAYSAGSQPRVQIQWTGNGTDPVFKFIDASFRVVIENLGFSAAPIAIKFTRVVADSLCHNNYIKHCLFDGQTIASVVWGYQLTESYPAGNDNFDGLTITECYFGNTQIGVLGNPKNNTYHLRIEKCDFGSGTKRPIVIKNVNDISLRDTNPLVSDYANGYYAIDIDAGDRWLSLDNIYTETPLLLKTTNWATDSARAAYLKNVVINSADTDATRVAIYIDQYAILDNVQATTNATPPLVRKMEFNGGFFATPFYRNANNPYIDNTNTGGGVSLTGQIYQAGLSAYMGGWTAIVYSAGNFTASDSQTWTVDSGDQITFKYMIVGKTMWLQFNITTSSVSGSCAELRLALPAYTPFNSSIQPIRLFNSSNKSGIAVVENAGTYVKIQDASGSNLVSSTNDTSVQGTICFEIL